MYNTTAAEIEPKISPIPERRLNLPRRDHRTRGKPYFPPQDSIRIVHSSSSSSSSIGAACSGDGGRGILWRKDGTRISRIGRHNSNNGEGEHDDTRGRPGIPIVQTGTLIRRRLRGGTDIVLLLLLLLLLLLRRGGS